MSPYALTQHAPILFWMPESSSHYEVKSQKDILRSHISAWRWYIEFLFQLTQYHLKHTWLHSPSTRRIRSWDILLRSICRKVSLQILHHSVVFTPTHKYHLILSFSVEDTYLLHTRYPWIVLSSRKRSRLFVHSLHSKPTVTTHIFFSTISTSIFSRSTKFV